MKRAAGPLLPAFAGVEPPGESPLYRQLYRRIRSAILGRTLAPGARLPSARTLAVDLSLSRNTVEQALAQLRAEGYLTRRVGSGSYVSDEVGATPAPESRRAAPIERVPRAVPAALSRRGRSLRSGVLGAALTQGRAFVRCQPSLDDFPLPIWNRLLARQARIGGADLLVQGDTPGYQPLRRAIAEYLLTARGVRCGWEQVIVVPSIQHGLALAAEVLLDPGDEVWLENPGYRSARMALQLSGARIVPIPVDRCGIDVAHAAARAPAARMAYVTPSHQYPLGVTLSLGRRLALLNWAAQRSAWVFEDDYDSEFRYVGRPLAAVQGQGGEATVVYAGTFNKAFFPGLRLAYLVVPAAVVDAFVAARQVADGPPPQLTQAALAAFMDEGHFVAHLRRMRAVYRERRDTLLEAVARYLGDRLRIEVADAGIHVAGWLPDYADDCAVSRRAAEVGLDLPALSTYWLGPKRGRGLLLNYGAVPPPAINRGIRQLAALLQRPHRNQSAARRRTANPGKP